VWLTCYVVSWDGINIDQGGVEPGRQFVLMGVGKTSGVGHCQACITSVIIAIATAGKIAKMAEVDSPARGIQLACDRCFQRPDRFLKRLKHPLQRILESGGDGEGEAGGTWVWAGSGHVIRGFPWAGGANSDALFQMS